MDKGQEREAVLIIATLDTKSEEVIYINQRIQKTGLDVVRFALAFNLKAVWANIGYCF